MSPGTLTDAGYLEAREPAFLLALAPAHPGPGFGVALLDLSTGEFTTAEYAGEDGPAVARATSSRSSGRARCSRRPGSTPRRRCSTACAHRGARSPPAEPWTFEYESARRTLLGQLKAQTLQGFGLEIAPAAVSAAGALVQYLRDTQKADLAHVRDIVLPHRRRLPARRSDHAAQPRSDRGADGGRDRLAAARDRSHRDADGRTAAAGLAAAAAGRAGADPGSARRGRRLRLPRHGAGQAARHAEVGARHRAAGGARRARAPPARAISSSLRQSIAAVPRVRMLLERIPGAAREAAWSRSSTIWPTSATRSIRR